MNLETIYSYFLESDSVCTDTRKLKDNCLFFALKGDNFNGNKFAKQALEQGAKYAIIDEETYKHNEQCILVDDVLKTLQELGTHHRKTLNLPVIALTGSNGKTTTKELINAVLSKTYKTSATTGNLNNHIGVPLTLLNLTDDTEISIVEMGANHQKEIEFLASLTYPDFGLITNFGKAHLEGFGGVEGVIKGKSELYVHLRKHHKTIFINETDPLQIKQAGDYDHIIKFGSRTSLVSSEPFVTLSYQDSEMATQLTGAYNYNNICVAIAIGEYFQVPKELIIKAICEYVPSNNRSQLMERKGHQIILDAYNANPTSMQAALNNFKLQSHPNKIAILGDMFELGEAAEKEHQAIADIAYSLGLKSLILVGENFYNVPNKRDDIVYFNSFEDLKNNFDTLNLESNLILIKGSRGMALERVLELL